MNLLNIIKLAKVLTKLEQISTDKGVVIVDATEAGAEVYVEQDGEVKPAKDGDYMLEDKRVIVVKDGKIAEVKDAPAMEPESTPADSEQKMEEDKKKRCMEGEEGTPAPATEPEATEPDEKKVMEDRIKELEADVANRDAIISEMTDKMKAMEEEINSLKTAPVEEKMAKVEDHKWGFKTYKNR